MAGRIEIDADRLRRLVVDEHQSFAEVGQLFGVSAATIARRAGELGISSTAAKLKRPQLHDADSLRSRFNSGSTIDDVARELDVNYDTVVTARRRHRIAVPRAPKRTVDVNEVARRLAAGESMGAIGRALGHSSSAISKVTRRHGLTG